MHRHHPVGADALPERRPLRPALDVLQQQARQQGGRPMQACALRGVGRQAGERVPGHVEQAVGVGDDALQEHLPRLEVVPVDRRLALQARPEVAGQAVRRRPALRGTTGQRGQGSHELADPVGQQVVGVLDRAPAQDEARVQHGRDRARPEVARPAGEGQAPLEDGPHLVVQDQLGAEQLQGALGEGALLQADAERHRPAQVEVGPRLGLLVGDAVVGLQQQRRRQQARRDARPPVGQAIEAGEVLIPEQVVALTGEHTVERVPTDMIQIRMIGSQHPTVGRACPKHLQHPLDASREVYTRSCSAGVFGRTSSTPPRWT